MLIVINDRRKWFKDLLLTCSRNIHFIRNFPRERLKTTQTAWMVRPLSGSTCLSGASRRSTTWGCSSGSWGLASIYLLRADCNISSVQITFRQQWNDNRSIITLFFPSPLLSLPPTRVERLLFWLLVLRLLCWGTQHDCWWPIKLSNQNLLISSKWWSWSGSSAIKQIIGFCFYKDLKINQTMPMCSSNLQSDISQG